MAFRWACRHQRAGLPNPGRLGHPACLTFPRNPNNFTINQYIHTYIHTYIHIHIHTYTYIHIHTHTYIRAVIHTYFTIILGRGIFWTCSKSKCSDISGSRTLSASCVISTDTESYSATIPVEEDDFFILVQASQPLGWMPLPTRILTHHFGTLFSPLPPRPFNFACHFFNTQPNPL